jgi:hypothetical protein
VPTKANLLSGYNCFAELAEACAVFCERVNGRVHRETNRVPAEALVAEQARLHPLPVVPFTAALGETRTVNADQTVRFGSVRYSTPPHRAWAVRRCGSAPTAVEGRGGESERGVQPR